MVYSVKNELTPYSYTILILETVPTANLLTSNLSAMSPKCYCNHHMHLIIVYYYMTVLQYSDKSHVCSDKRTYKNNKTSFFTMLY